MDLRHGWGGVYVTASILCCAMATTTAAPDDNDDEFYLSSRFRAAYGVGGGVVLLGIAACVVMCCRKPLRRVWGGVGVSALLAGVAGLVVTMIFVRILTAGLDVLDKPSELGRDLKSIDACLNDRRFNISAIVDDLDAEFENAVSVDIGISLRAATVLGGLMLAVVPQLLLSCLSFVGASSKAPMGCGRCLVGVAALLVALMSCVLVVIGLVASTGCAELDDLPEEANYVIGKETTDAESFYFGIIDILNGTDCADDPRVSRWFEPGIFSSEYDAIEAAACKSLPAWSMTAGLFGVSALLALISAACFHEGGNAYKRVPF